MLYAAGKVSRISPILLFIKSFTFQTLSNLLFGVIYEIWPFIRVEVILNMFTFDCNGKFNQLLNKIRLVIWLQFKELLYFTTRKIAVT